MRIAVFQGPFASAGVASNLERLARLAHECAGRGIALLVCPEMYLTGYAIGPAAVRRWPSRSTGRPPPGPPRLPAKPVWPCSMAIRSWVRTTASTTRPCSWAEMAAGSPTIARPICTARSTVTPLRPAPARRPWPMLDGVRLGILICYDVEFPENVRLLAIQGVELIAVPTANMVPYSFVVDALVPTRAYENHVFVAYANRCGREGNLEYVGRSCVVGPDGSDLARAGAGEELIVADVDLARLRDAPPLNPYLADRRPELYAGLAAPGTRS